MLTCPAAGGWALKRDDLIDALIEKPLGRSQTAGPSGECPMPNAQA